MCYVDVNKIMSETYDKLAEDWSTSWMPKKAVFEGLQEMAEDVDHPHCLDASSLLFKSTIAQYSRVGSDSLIRIIDKSASHPELAFQAAKRLRKSANTNVIAKANDYLDLLASSYQSELSYHAVIVLNDLPEDIHHPDVYAKALKWWSSWNSQKYNKGGILLIQISRTIHHIHAYDAACLLWKSKLFHYNDEGCISLKQIVYDDEHSKRLEAAQYLFNSSLQKYYSLGANLLTAIGHELNSTISYEAALMLLKSSNFSVEGKSIMILLCKEEGHVRQFEAACELWTRSFQLPEVRRVLVQVIHQGLLDEKSIQAAKLLWSSVNGEDKQVARTLLLQICICTDDHPEKINSSLLLLQGGDDMDQEAARLVLYEVVQYQHQHVQRFEVIDALWKISGRGSRDHEIAGRALIDLIDDAYLTNVVSSHVLKAVELMWAQTQHEEYHERARLAIITFASNHQVPRDKALTLIHLLRESNDPEDQSLGASLLMEHFPDTSGPSDSTRIMKSFFDWGNIRPVMPSSLEDLSSAHDIDIIKIFQEIFDHVLQHENDEHSPYFLSLQTITGESHPQVSLKEIRLRVLGFVRTLLGQRLQAGEVGGWQMHDIHKDDMINSLKHLSRQMNVDIHSQDEHKIRQVMIAASIVFNALLYCPTGQAEGIDSAVNFYIRHQDVASSDVKLLVGKRIMTSAVIKAFFNAFHQGGGVHGMSRARVVLSHELGLQHAITGFQEQISKVSDHDIPRIYDEYFAVFNLSFVLEEAKRNIPSKEEDAILQQSLLIRTSSLHNQATMIKMNKPITIGNIVSWLHDQQVEEEVMHLDLFGREAAYAITICSKAPSDDAAALKCDVCGYGISEEFDTISNRGLLRVLVRMGYLTENALPSINAMIV